MLLNDKLWEAVALGITAEDSKIRLFIHHNLSRGIAREALLRSIIVQHTVHPFCVRSGFIHTDDPTTHPHKQCDVLIYDPRKGQPYYQIEEFVVTSPNAAVVLVEVKSAFGKKTFNEVLEMQKYALSVKKPLMSFVYEGWKLNTLAKELKAHASDPSSLPFCIAVHKHNYFIVRDSSFIPPRYLIINFSKSKKPGMATAYFLNVYYSLIAGFEKNIPYDHVLGGLDIWFQDQLTIVPPEGKWLLTPDGQLRSLAQILKKRPTK